MIGLLVFLTHRSILPTETQSPSDVFNLKLAKILLDVFCHATGTSSSSPLEMLHHLKPAAEAQNLYLTAFGGIISRQSEIQVLDSSSVSFFLILDCFLFCQNDSQHLELSFNVLI